VPAGSRFKGYETYQVQELVLSVHAVRYLRERWITPDGQTIVAPLPDGTQGHFGPNLRRFVLMQYHQGQTTLPRLAALLQSVGLAISEREIQRLLTERQDDFLDETRDVLRAGLRNSPWISVDDTGARHKAKNGYCTQIGNEHFTWFGTRPSKSRLNFLDLLRAGHTDFVLNDATFDYMRTRALVQMRSADGYAGIPNGRGRPWTSRGARKSCSPVDISTVRSSCCACAGIFGSS
jgi:Transposase IS66 family